MAGKQNQEHKAFLKRWWSPFTAVNERYPPDGQLNILKRFSLLSLKDKITAIYRFWVGRLDRPERKIDEFGDNLNTKDTSRYYVRWYLYWGGEEDNYQNYLGVYDYLTLGLLRSIEAFFRGHWSRRRLVHAVAATPVGIVFHGLLNMVRAAFGIVLTIPTVIIGSIVYAILKVTVLQGIALVKAEVQGAAEDQKQAELKENRAPYRKYLEQIHRADSEPAPTSKVGQLVQTAKQSVKNLRKPKVEPITQGQFISKSREAKDKFDDPKVYDYHPQKISLSGIKCQYDSFREKTQYYYPNSQLPASMMTKVVIEGDWTKQNLTKEYFDLPQPMLDHLNRIRGQSDNEDVPLTAKKTSRGVERTVFYLHSKKERNEQRQDFALTRFLFLADPLYKKPVPIAPPTQSIQEGQPLAQTTQEQPESRWEKVKGFFKPREKTTGEKMKDAATKAKNAVTPTPSIKGRVVGGAARLIL